MIAASAVLWWCIAVFTQLLVSAVPLAADAVIDDGLPVVVFIYLEPVNMR